MFAIMRPDAFCTFLRFIPSAPSQVSILDQTILRIFNRCPPSTVSSSITFIIISTSSPSVAAKIVAWGNSQWLRVCGEFSEDLACLSSLTGSLPDALYHHPFIAGPVALQKLWYIMHGDNLLIFLKFNWRGTSTQLWCLCSFWFFQRTRDLSLKPGVRKCAHTA